VNHRPKRSLLFGALAGLMSVSSPVLARLRAVEPTVEEIDDAVEAVFARSEYGTGQSGLSRLLWDNPVGRWVRDRWQDFLDWLSGRGGGGGEFSLPDTVLDPGRFAALGLVAILVILLVGIVVYRLARTREDQETRAQRRSRSGSVSIADLERMAAEAEASGSFEEAVRLRYQVGLRRLDDVGALELSPATTTGSVRRSVSLAAFDSVANVFESAAFSDAGATSDDVSASKELWEDIFTVMEPGEGTPDE